MGAAGGLCTMSRVRGDRRGSRALGRNAAEARYQAATSQGCAEHHAHQSVRWFSQANCTAADADIWDAATHVDYELVFEMLRARRGDVFQWNDDYRRVVFGDGQIQYQWRRDDVSRS